MYVAWFRDCGRRLATEQNKPWAYIILDEECIAVNLDLFRWRCLRQDPNEGLEQRTVISAALQGLVVEQHLQNSDHWSLPSLNAIEDAVTIGWTQRKTQAKLWTEMELSWIIDAYLVHTLADGSFSVTNAISPSPLNPRLEGLVGRMLLDAGSIDTADFGIPTVASYLANWALGHRDRESWPSMKFEQHSPSCYSRQYFDQRLRKPMGNAARKTVGSKAVDVVNEIYTLWRRYMIESCDDSTIEDVFRRHVGRLRTQSAFLEAREYSVSCGTCGINPWRVMLPCRRHGMCNLCLSRLDVDWRSYGGAQVKTCPICCMDLGTWRAKVEPPGAYGRILSLDGGGVKGLIQLEILELLEEKIGLNLPLRRFFDLIVGTSIGGITALGLGVLAWDIAICRDRLLRFSKEAFQPLYRLRDVQIVEA
ncbi:hypothetical protein LTR56_017891 [Elasticomyces elasticus]|nr:hypothetical protein LTR56_017891 [Elasticomyces elasticus]KAK3637142.1 hypothetical protein LTR22_018398 [Elasticomyces elasticus]KAK4914156.1 hypothetical protein LTR49_017588 [Elasticomyces elasticus]KAK5733876.1 hypothetical protein LTS12_026845 [Elasticomyces elasticus]